MIFCSLTVLSSTFLLSAAHCFLSYQKDGGLFNKLEEPKYSMFALAGTHDFTRGSLGRQSVRSILPENVFLHPKYDCKQTLWDSTGFVHNDLALIKLEKPFKLGGNIFPSCLFEFNRQAFENASFIAAGFGAQNPSSSYNYRLRTAVDLKLSSACSRRIRYFNETIALCADGGNSSIFFNHGDSGA